MSDSFSNKGSNPLHSKKSFRVDENGVPLVRIGIVDSESLVNFKIDGRFSILDKNNSLILENIESDLKWRAKVDNGIKAAYNYGVLLSEFRKKEEADNFVEKIDNAEFDINVVKTGTKFKFNEGIVFNNVRYRVIAGYWDDKKEAANYANSLRNDYDGVIIKNRVSEPDGKLEIFDSKYDKHVEGKKLIKIIPQSDNYKMTIFDIKANSISSQNNKIDKILKNKAEIVLNNDGRISIINIFTIDEYLVEMLKNEFLYDDFPELLKAYAIAARGNYLSEIGLHSADNCYDFYLESNSEDIINHDEKTVNLIEKAVDETKGLVTVKNGVVCNSVYTPICGGCSEDYDDICNSDDNKLISGIFDNKNNKVEGFELNINNKKMVEKWLNANPDVYCNLKGENFGKILYFATKYFRWKVTYPRRELENIIKEKLGENIGTLYDIIPLVRGDSGRIKELEILGSKKNIVLKNDNIKNVLSNNELPSMCFIVTAEIEDDGTPVSFTFYGAGYGYGSGMCLVGGVTMAQQDYDYESILNHYYNGLSINKIY